MLQELGQQEAGPEQSSLLEENNQRLNSLYERQNSKRDARETARGRPASGRSSDRPIRPADRYAEVQDHEEEGESADRQMGNGGGGRRGERAGEMGGRALSSKVRTFERGDLRHSLRERRAARLVPTNALLYRYRKIFSVFIGSFSIITIECFYETLHDI